MHTKAGLHQCTTPLIRWLRTTFLLHFLSQYEPWLLSASSPAVGILAFHNGGLMVVPTKLYSGHLSTHFSQQQKSRSPKQKAAGMRSMHTKAGLHQRTSHSFASWGCLYKPQDQRPALGGYLVPRKLGSSLYKLLAVYTFDVRRSWTTIESRVRNFCYR